MELGSIVKYSLDFLAMLQKAHGLKTKSSFSRCPLPCNCPREPKARYILGRKGFQNLPLLPFRIHIEIFILCLRSEGSGFTPKNGGHGAGLGEKREEKILYYSFLTPIL
jgi:hypothetical protein